MKLKLVIALVVAALPLFTLSTPVSPQADVPTWSVGDSWGMGKKSYDISSFLNSAYQEMENLYGFSYSGSGTMDFYLLYKVTGETSSQYTLSLDEGIEIDATINMSGSYGGQSVSAAADMTMSILGDGSLNVNKSDLSISGGTLTLDMDVKVNSSGTSGGMAANVNMTLGASGTMTVQFDPALDLFDFPISVGENWQIETTMTTSGSMTGSVNIPGYGSETIDVPLNESTEITITATCTGTTQIQTADGNTVTAYVIELSGTGANPFITGTTLYYSPEEKFIVSQQIDLAKALSESMGGSTSELSSYTMGFSSTSEGEELFTASPMTESEVSEAIETIGTSESNILPLLIVVIVIVGVVGIAIATVKRG